MTRSAGLRVAVLSSLPRDSGGYLRARAISMALQHAGAQIIFVEATKSMPFMLDYLVSLLRNSRILWTACDVVIAQKALVNAALPLLAKRALGTPVVVDIDDIDWGFRSGPLSWVNRLMIRPVPRLCDCVTFHSDLLRPFLADDLRVDPTRLFQLPQGVDTDVFRPRDRSNRRPPLPADFVGVPLIIHPAHMNVACELEAIFHVLARVLPVAPQVRLVVIGGGPREAYFRRCAVELGVGHATWFSGHVGPRTVADYMCAADVGLVYLHPTPANEYRQSMKLREMLAVGLPVVCNDAGELSGFARFTYQTSSRYDDVADALVRLLLDGSDGREVSASSHVRETMDWQHIGQRLYERLSTMI